MKLYLLFSCYYDEGCGSTEHLIKAIRDKAQANQIKDRLNKKYGHGEHSFSTKEIDICSIPEKLTKEEIDQIIKSQD